MSDVWDRELDDKAYTRLRPAWKGARARLSLERKVTILEGWARDGVPEGARVRRTRPGLRAWSDTTLRLWAWSDPNVDHPGRRNADFVERFIRAVAAIDQRSTSAVKVSKRNATLDATREAYQMLLEQNAQLLAEVIHLRKREAPVPTRIPK